MKKLVLMFVAIAAISFTSCGGGQKTQPAVDVEQDTVAVDTAEVADTAEVDTAVVAE